MTTYLAEFHGRTNPEHPPDEDQMFDLCIQGLKSSIPEFMTQERARELLRDWFPGRVAELELV